MALPTFFIIGAPKAGTTSLHSYLDQHPEIQMSENKEPRFFAGPESDIPYAPGRVGDRDAYEALFDASIAVRGESSTDYTIHPRRSGAPERIRDLVPDARFLYLVRDPIARTISHHRMRTAFLGERQTLTESLKDLGDRRSPYVWPSLYASQIERYLQHFPRERIMVIDQAELLADRRTTLRATFAFLSVEQQLDSARFDELHSESAEWRAYPPAYARAVDSMLAPASRWVPARARRAVRRVLDTALWRPIDTPQIDPDTHERLSELYRPEVERLRELTGKAFATWSF